MQMARQADAGGAAGIMMMSNSDDPSTGPPGSGVGGSGSQEAAAAAAMALAAAFSHETVEASQDNPGDNVETEVRRKTEQGTSAVAFTRGAAGQFDKSRAAPPPPVERHAAAACRLISCASNNLPAEAGSHKTLYGQRR